MTTNWLTPQQIVDADARFIVDHAMRRVIVLGHDPAYTDLSYLRSLILAEWQRDDQPDFLKTETHKRAWTDGGVFAEAFDRIWRERVAAGGAR